MGELLHMVISVENASPCVIFAISRYRIHLHNTVTPVQNIQNTDRENAMSAIIKQISGRIQSVFYACSSVFHGSLLPVNIR